MDIFSGIGNLFGEIGSAVDSIGNFFSLMLNPHTYVRIFFVAFGILLIFGAVTYGR